MNEISTGNKLKVKITDLSNGLYQADVKMLPEGWEGMVPFKASNGIVIRRSQTEYVVLHSDTLP